MGGFWGQLARAGVQAATGAIDGDAQRRQRLLVQQRQETQDALLAHARQVQEASAADEASRQRALDALDGVMTGQKPADPLGMATALGAIGTTPQYQQVDATRYIDRANTKAAQGERAFQRQQQAAQATEASRERAQLFLAQQKEAADAARARAQNATTLQAAGIRANATAGGQTAEKAGKASADLANQYAHAYPVESADKFASNAANALLGVQLARQGNREGHLMAITGFLRQTHPDAVVRTNDKGMLEEVQGVPANVQMSVRRMFGQGGLLTPDALTEIEHATHTLIAGSRATLAPVQAFYGGLARTRGADSASVVRDPFQGLDGPPAGPAGGGRPGQSGRAPLSNVDRARAKTDPKFAAWLTQQGYTP